MLVKCSIRAARNLKDASKIPSLRCSARYNSTVPERTRKFLNARESFRSKPLFRQIVLGTCFGTAVLIGWQIYSFSRKGDYFVSYSLVAKQPVSSTASIFHLQPRQDSANFELYKDAWRRGIWNVHFKQPQLQIVRAYTPLPPIDESAGEEEETLRFLIRNDPHGEVSSYLHKLPIGVEIAMRGPNWEYELTPEVRQVVFFAGGTGIAPALQIAHALLEGNKTEGDDNSRDRKLHILWANRMREDCLGGVSDAPPAESVPPKPTWSGLFSKSKPKPTPPVSQEKGLIVQELEALKKKYPGQVTVEYFVNAEDTWIDDDAVFRALSRFDDKDFTTGYATPQEQRQILISGPPGFISYLAGPKEWKNGREEQGAVSKIVAHAISRNPHNVKVWKI
ncbi:uncharacterized protein Z518_00517 [Rhinocladiella mackenziei CBS 650.93]|uniref:FAD-binding FR-type domain-containing protein n=1 Tax=Rhinocladiella mackenziei CBS 650.93 TaxID=1442369 RepID=A0A0D2G458_9EURO|nr:uncharacterized protein Z518_00517 [Rhinocladiella mackenziei CBS 650.93]KIX09437.1 hypothetical protein Z518_00517 [Rhinocladiella mackenziei CBS 650.93]